MDRVSNQKLLVIGGDSSLAPSILRQSHARGIATSATTRRPFPRQDLQDFEWLPLDLCGSSEARRLSRRDFTHVIVLAGIGSISRCENEPSVTARVNVDGTWIAARELVASGARVTILSTSQVFSRWQAHPKPSSPRRPTCEYGRQKCTLEDLTLSLDGTQIVRLTKVIPKHFPLFENWISTASRGEAIHAFSNVSVAPTTAEYAARRILQFATQDYSERIHHISAADEVTYFELAGICMEYAGLQSRIEPLTTENDPRKGIITGPHARLSSHSDREVAPSTRDAVRPYFQDR